MPTKSRFKIKSARKKCKIESISSTPSDGRLDILLKSPVNENDEVWLNYRDLKKDQLTGVVQSKSGVDLPSIKNASVENITEELVLPAIVDAYLDESYIRLEFDSLINGYNLKTKRFKIKIGRKRHKAANARIDEEDATTLLITIKDVSSADIYSPMTVSYRDPKGDQDKGILEDMFGNDISSFKNVNIDI